MDPTEFIWHNGALVKWDDAKVHVLTHTLHYGAGAFEGIRVYETARGPAIFHLGAHIDRLFYSAEALEMEVPYSKSVLTKATIATWHVNKLSFGYIRPLIYFGFSQLGLNPQNVPVEVAIACWEWGKYLPHEMVDIKTSKYIRIHPRSTVADAKICGHYVNSIFAGLELRGTNYHEALLLDVDGNIAEGPGENFFIIRGNVISTPKLGTILKGITRQVVIEIARGHGFEVREEDLTLEDAYAADEAFFTGTAAEVSPIRSIDDKTIGTGEIGPVTEKLKDEYHRVVTGEVAEFDTYLTYVNEVAGEGCQTIAVKELQPTE